MTWLSRLLPKSPRPERRTFNHHARSQREKGRRRVAILEPLENRTVLSNVSVMFTLPSTLTIMGDTHNDNFKIAEGAGAIITVSPGAASTTINGTSFPYTSPHAVTTITVKLPGHGNLDTVSLTGLGATSTGVRNVSITTGGNPSSTGPYLNLSVTGVHNTGALSVTANNSQLLATVDSSQFSSIDILQTGCCPANVTLTNDKAGAVDVDEGSARGDTITLNHDTFLSTELEQGNTIIPPMDKCDSQDDTVKVTNSAVRDLTVEQDLDGKNQSITVDTVTVSLTSFGVRTEQEDGDGSTSTVNAITTAGVVNPNRLVDGPPGISIDQGDGVGDTATASNSVLPGNIHITQDNGGGDVASILGDTIGLTFAVPPYLFDLFGWATIDQGDGVADVAVLDKDVVNNVAIHQGDSDNSVGCTLPPGDIAEINDTTVTSDIFITQGDGDDDPTPTDGNGIVAIGFDVLGAFGSSPVTAGGRTDIDLSGANNTVYLGDTGSSFSTGFLDVFTGDFGGAFVSATNVTVFDGSFENPGGPEITGGGDGNVLQDNGGNTNVDADVNFAVV